MKRSKLWTGLASLLSFLLVFAILGYNCMLGYEGSVNSFLSITTSEVENPDDVDDADLVYYESEYGELNADNLQLLIADAYEEAVIEQEEGSVLLKNEDNALPLSSDEMRVTLFGHAVAQPLYKNHTAGSNGYLGEYCIDLYTALVDAGFAVNDTLYQAYASDSSTSRSAGNGEDNSENDTDWSLGEEDISFYTNELQASWEDDYNDVAIVMFAREGGEGLELYTEDPEGISQLALHQSEKDLLQMIKDSGKFSKTIVLLNSGNPMEVNWLDEYDVDACLWIGCPGQRGFEGVANILTGEANPSGRLTDTYAVNSLSAPSVVNGSYNNQTWTNLNEVTSALEDAEENIAWYDVQAESIYIGYKYYETRYEDVILNQGNADSAKGSSTGNAWDYTAEVSYPFGYGLSYTTFDQTLDNVEINGDDITVTVTVTNTGDAEGQCVVQVYAQTPYGDYEKQNLVEKSSIQLLDFGKTGKLKPGESETVTITGDKYLLASYDYTNAKSYYLSDGTYYIAIGDNAHDALNNVLAAKGAAGMVDVDGTIIAGDAGKTYTWEEKFDSDTYADSLTGEKVTNQFDDCDINYWIEDSVTYLSRNDWDATYPMEATQLEATEDMIKVLSGRYYTKPEDAPSVSDYTLGDNQNIPLAAMIGLDFDDPEWDVYLNQFTLEELASLISDMFGTTAIESVGKPNVVAGDGPDGLESIIGEGGIYNEELYGDGRDDTCYPCENILAATFSKERLARRADLMAEDAMYLGVTYMWMPGMDLHRTPFGGRNFEYYSEDANMTYICASIEVGTAEEKGVHAGEKHVTGNDQENNRQGISVFFNEQAFREGSLRGAEGAITVGKGQALMQSFNRLGMKWSSASEALCTQVIRNEWGFMGIEETDAVGDVTGFKTYFDTTLAAGTNIYCLDFAGVSTSTIVNCIESDDDGYLLGKLRDSAHYNLYVVANSAPMNGYSTDSVIVTITPWWKTAMYAVIAIVAILDVICLVLMTIRRKKTKDDGTEEVK